MRGKLKVRWSADFASILGFLTGIGGIIAGLVLEGGRLSDVAQFTGAMIVITGTLGAVMVTTPTRVFVRALKRAKVVFFEPRYPMEDIIAQILEFSNRARRNGIVSLETDVNLTEDEFLRKSLSMGVDGAALEELRRTMEIEIDAEERNGRAEAKVYEAAGGYAPTIGIIGAVLGLIQVMKNLQDIEKVGHGIAVAFVATIYGVGLANLVLLPAASKIRNRVEELRHLREMMLEGVCNIVQGVHPGVIEQRLQSWTLARTDSASPKSQSAWARRFASEHS